MILDLQQTKYGLERTKAVRRQSWWNNRQDAIRFKCWFEMSSDNFKNVSQSVMVSSLETLMPNYCSVLNQVLKVSSWTCQQSVEVLSKSVTFLDFRLSQGNVATECRWGGNLCGVYIENFLTNHLVKEFLKNRSTFAKVIIKHQVAYFFGTRCK